MALTNEQIKQLDAAYERIQAGNPGAATDSNAGDIANVEYATKNLGYVYKPRTTVQTTAPTQSTQNMSYVPEYNQPNMSYAPGYGPMTMAPTTTTTQGYYLPAGTGMSNPYLSGPTTNQYTSGPVTNQYTSGPTVDSAVYQGPQYSPAYQPDGTPNFSTKPIQPPKPVTETTYTPPSSASTNVGSNVETAEKPLNADEIVELSDPQAIIDRLRRNNSDFFADVNIENTDASTTDTELQDLAKLDSGTSNIYDEYFKNIQKAQDEYRNLLLKSQEEQDIGTQLADLQEEANRYKQSYQAGFDAISDRVVPLEVQVGEQAALNRQFQRGYQQYIDKEANLLNRLGLAQEARQAEMDFAATGVTQLQNNLQLQIAVDNQIAQQEQNIFNRAMTLRQDAQNVLGTIIDSFAGMTFDELNDATKLKIQSLASQAGVPFDLLTQGMEVQKNQIDFDNIINMTKAQGTADMASQLDVANLAVKIMGEGGVDLGTAFAAANQILGGQSLIQSRGGTGEFMGQPGVMRTDRHNNPTAFTTQIAEQAGLREGIDYEVGDPFPDNPNLFTARLLKDPIQTTIDVIDKIGFYTQGGQQRWTHTAMPQQQWLNLSDEGKRQVITDMYKNEGGSGELVGTSSITPKFEDFLSGIIKKDGLDTKDIFSFEQDIAKHFDSVTKELRTANRNVSVIEEGYAGALQAIKDGTSLNAPSQAILVQFQKMLDPTSVVRESEYARSAEGLSLINQIQGKYEKLAQGGAGVTIEDLKTFYDLSKQLQSIYKDDLYDFASRTEYQADRYGLDINAILTPDILSILNAEGIIDISNPNDLNSLVSELGGQEVTNQSPYTIPDEGGHYNGGYYLPIGY